MFVTENKQVYERERDEVGAVCICAVEDTEKLRQGRQEHQRKREE